MRGLLSLVVILAVWQLACAAGWANQYLLPPPTEVFKAFRELAAGGVLLMHTLASLRRVVSGLFFACLAALPLGVLTAARPRVRAYVQPLVEMLRPIPPIAWIPLAILWFGIRGDGASNFITFLAAFFPLFVSTFAGVTGIEKIHVNAARCMGAGNRMLLLDIALPSALPFLVTGLRLSLGAAWMSVIAAELIASTSGLGYMIEMNRSMVNIPNVICGMITIGAVGYLMNEGIVRLERQFSWKARQ
jgi:NitT/TauT family transport system permease protein/sulfonate transport system permease protein